MPDDDARPQLTAPLELRAGPVRALLDGIDLRAVSLSEEPLLDRIYVAVRARDWTTVPPDVTDVDVRASDRAFEVSFTAHHRDGPLHFEWRGGIKGGTDGHIGYCFEGEAVTDFDYCRIGICVLHPDRLAGATFVAHTAEGDIAGRLPLLIAPQLLRDGGVVPVIPVFDRLAVTSDAGETVVIESGGESFEMEDQRNWTDASFKSYIPPIRPGYPYGAVRGQRFSQVVSIRASGAAVRSAFVSAERSVEMAVAHSSGGTFPAIGHALPKGFKGFAPMVRQRLTRIRPDHLRFTSTTGADAMELLQAAVEAAGELGCPLEVELFVDPADPSSACHLVERIARTRVAVARWLVYDAQDAYRRATSEAAVRIVREALGRVDAVAPLVAGTPSDFVQLNRARTLFEGVDGLTWSISPTAHACDDRSTMENATAQRITVETARTFAEGRELCVGPVELGRRDRPADPRQSTDLAAAWTVASLSQLVEPGLAAATYFETDGDRGLMSSSGEPYPVYDVFVQLARMRGGIVREFVSSAPREIAGLGVERDGELLGIIANLTDQRRAIHRTVADRDVGRTRLEPYEILCLG